MDATPLSPVLGLAALVVVGGSGVAWFRKIASVQIPEDRRGFVAIWILGLGLAIAALASGPGWLGGTSAVLALIGGVFFLFTVSISRQRVGADAIRVGATLPDFRALDEHGEWFEASSLAGNPTLIKFFRGHW